MHGSCCDAARRFHDALRPAHRDGLSLSTLYPRLSYRYVDFHDSVHDGTLILPSEIRQTQFFGFEKMGSQCVIEIRFEEKKVQAKTQPAHGPLG